MSLFIFFACRIIRLTGTQAQENRFYDDKTTYTGVHKSGGPTIVDKEKITLNQLLDRSSADVRGLKQVCPQILCFLELY